MGGSLFQDFPDLTSTADEILGYSVQDLCRNNPEGRLRETQYTQPALFVVNALTYMRRLYDTGRIPAMVAGHSLGEYNALLAAGSFDFATGLKLVKKRGELMAQAGTGGMAAVMGIPAGGVQRILDDSGVQGVSAANFNTPEQTVISGSVEGIDQLEQPFTQAGAAYIKLNVSGAFHSKWMLPAQNEFARFLSQFKFRAPAIPVISNLRAQPYDGEDTVENLVSQISNPVRWAEIARYLLSAGADEIVEIGPGRILTGMISRVRQAA